MKPAPFDYVRPRSLADAMKVNAAISPDTKLIGGGQSLGPMLNLRLARPEHLVDISHLPDLLEATERSASIRIGAAVTHAQIEDGKTPQPIEGMLRYVASGIAYRAVRNKGTLGGSLAHADPAADWISTMIALNATIETATASDGSNKLGKGREIPMEQFMLGAYRTALVPGEILIAVSIPKYSAGARWGYYKICRKVGEFADALGAIVVDPTNAYCRVVAGSTGGPPLILGELARHIARTARAPGKSRVSEALCASGLQVSDVKLQQLAVSIQRAIARAVA